MYLNAFKDVPIRFRATEAVLLGFSQLYPTNSLLKKLRQSNSARANDYLSKRRKKQNRKGKLFEIERVENLSEERFKSHYLKKGIPVIFSKESANWSCTKKWNFDFFDKNYGESSFHLIASKGFITDQEKKDYTISDNESAGKVTISNFIEDQRSGGSSNLRFCPLLEVHEELKDDLDKDWLKKMTVSIMGVGFQIFMAAKDKFTPTHNSLTSFFFIHAEGSKRWTFYPGTYYPLLNLSPDRLGYFYSDINPNKPEKYELIDGYQAELQEGDILYGPAWMWHFVENNSDSIGVSYRFSHLRGALVNAFGLTALRVLLAKPNFLVILWDSFFGKSVVDRDRNLKQPRINKL